MTGRVSSIPRMPRSPMSDAELAGDSAPTNTIVKTERMHDWAVTRQNALMAHTSQQVSRLRREVDEAKAMAMQSSEEFWPLSKEMDHIKAPQKETSTALRALSKLEEEFKKLKLESSSSRNAAANHEEGKR